MNVLVFNGIYIYIYIYDFVNQNRRVFGLMKSISYFCSD